MARIDHVGLLLLDIEAQRLEASFGLLDRKRQAYVTKAHCAANEVSLFYLR